MASVQVNQMLAAAAAACEDKKAENIRILALDPSESGLTDYFLICTGANDRQTVAITDEIELRLKREFATYPNSVEGRRQGEWVLMDYVDFIVHVFLPEKRAYYGLERLRPSATTLSVNELNEEVKAAITARRPPRGSNAGSAGTKAAAKTSGAGKGAGTVKKTTQKVAQKGSLKRKKATKSTSKTTASAKRAPAAKRAAKTSAKAAGTKRAATKSASAKKP